VCGLILSILAIAALLRRCISRDATWFPEWAPLVTCGRYRLAVHTVAEAMQVQARLNWFCIPQPIAADRRGAQRGRRPRVDRRGSVLSTDGLLTPSVPLTRPPFTEPAWTERDREFALK
jgi:hypothetical protein